MKLLKKYFSLNFCLERKIVYDNVYPRWLEIGIAADNSVVEFHGTRMQHYILALVNIVSHNKNNPLKTELFTPIRFLSNSGT